MVYQSGTDAEKPTALKHAIKSMPNWKWRLLTIGLVIGLIGVGAQMFTVISGQKPPANQTSVARTATPQGSASPSGAPTPGGSRGFVSEQAPAPADSQSDQSAPSADSSSQQPNDLSQLWKPLMTKVGFSLFIGIVTGVLFRAFLKTAMAISMLVIGGAMALSYYHVVNVDLTSVKSETAQATSWLADQGYRVKDMLFHALPSSTSAGIGFFLGLKRR